MGFKIAFFGSSLVSSYWNGAATYYRGIIKALHANGHSTVFFEPDIYERQQHRDMEDPDWARVVVYQPDEKEISSILEDLSEFDIIVKASGVGIFDELLEAAVVRIKKEHQLTVFWDVDAPATLDRVNNNNNDPFRSLIPQYDLILTYGGGDPVVDAYKKLKCRECIPVYNALDPETHYPEKPDPRFICDLAFLGNRLPDREERVEKFFLEPAGVLPAKKFLLGGNGWHDKHMPDNIIYYGHVSTNDHNKFNCSPLAVLNISRSSMASYGFSPATRVFEAAGAGACIITDYWEGIDNFFEPGKEILVAKTGGDVITLIKELTPERAENIGKAALKRALASHTYRHRARLLENIFNQHINMIKT